MLKGTQAQFKDTFIFPPEARPSFQTLKEAFTKALLLLHFDFQKPIQLETDASAVAIARILSQPKTYPIASEERSRRQNQWHSVAFWGKILNDAERNYNTPRSKLLAIVDAVKHWGHYLERATYPITVLTNHSNLQQFMTKRDLRSQNA